MARCIRFLITLVSALAASIPATAETPPLVVPFDFSGSEIVLAASVPGTPLHMFLDTGVNPSAVDIERAKAIGLKIDYAGGGAGSGDGSAAHVIVYPTSIDELVIGGRRFGTVEALTIDTAPVSQAFGQVNNLLSARRVGGGAVRTTH